MNISFTFYFLKKIFLGLLINLGQKSGQLWGVDHLVEKRMVLAGSLANLCFRLDCWLTTSICTLNAESSSGLFPHSIYSLTYEILFGFAP